MTLFDPMEQGESRCEDWLFENVDGDSFTCFCGQTSPLAEAVPSSPHPYALPMCRACADEEQRPTPTPAITIDPTDLYGAVRSETEIARCLVAELKPHVERDECGVVEKTLRVKLPDGCGLAEVAGVVNEGLCSVWFRAVRAGDFWTIGGDA